MSAVEQFSNLAAETDLNDAEALQRLTAHFKQIFPDFHNMFITNAAGTTVTFYPLHNMNGQPTLGLNFSDRLYFMQNKESLQLVISDVFAGRGGVSEPVVNISAPIMSGRQFQGIAGGALDLGYISQRIQALTTYTNIHVTIVDRNRHVIASTRSANAVMQEYDWKKRRRDSRLEGRLLLLAPQKYQKSDETVGKLVIHQDHAVIRPWGLDRHRGIVVCALSERIVQVLYQNTYDPVDLRTDRNHYVLLHQRSIVRPIIRLAHTTTDLPNKILEKKRRSLAQQPIDRNYDSHCELPDHGRETSLHVS